MSVPNNTIVRRNWHSYKKEWEIQFKRKWEGNRDCWCSYCMKKCTEYFDLTPAIGLEESIMCIECAEKLKNLI